MRNNFIFSFFCFVAIATCTSPLWYSPLKNAYHSYQAKKYSIENTPAASYPEIYKHWEYSDWYYDVTTDTFVNFLNSPLAKFDTDIISKESLADFIQYCDIETIPILGKVDSNIIQKYHNHLQSRFCKVQHKQIQIFNISDSLTRITGVKNKTFLIIKNSYAYPEAYIISNATRKYNTANYNINAIIDIPEVSETPSAFAGFHFETITEYNNYTTRSLVLNYEKNDGDKTSIFLTIDTASMSGNKILTLNPEY
jgi:hypothetical protein